MALTTAAQQDEVEYWNDVFSSCGIGDNTVKCAWKWKVDDFVYVVTYQKSPEICISCESPVFDEACEMLYNRLLTDDINGE